MAEVCRNLWSHLVQPPAPAGTRRAGCPGPHPYGFWKSPRGEAPQHPWATCAGVQSPTQHRSAAWCSYRASCAPAVPIASCSGTGHHRKETGSILFLHLPFRYLDMLITINYLEFFQVSRYVIAVLHEHWKSMFNLCPRDLAVKIHKMHSEPKEAKFLQSL